MRNNVCNVLVMVCMAPVRRFLSRTHSAYLDTAVVGIKPCLMQSAARKLCRRSSSAKVEKLVVFKSDLSREPNK
jgi:hypothetical protein